MEECRCTLVLPTAGDVILAFGGACCNDGTALTRYRVRHYRTGDHEAIADLFTCSVHELTTAEYDAEARLAWAPSVPDYERWRFRCELWRPFLSVDTQGAIAAFLELDPTGHVGATYVHPQHARRGAMAILMDYVEVVALGAQLPRLYAEVSLTARPYFRKRGWIAAGDNRITRAGIILINTNMTKPLAS